MWILIWQQPVSMDAVMELCLRDGAVIVSADTQQTGSPWNMTTVNRCVVDKDGPLTTYWWVTEGIMPEVYEWKKGDRIR